MIIIAGDSWGCGEWGPGGSGIIVHTGLEQYLQDDGYNVINISYGGSSNIHVCNQLNTSLYTLSCVKKVDEVKNIFVFQTEWHRDHRYTLPVDSIFDISYIHMAMSDYYYRLSDIASKYNVRIGLIGGCTDILWLDAFEKEYPGVFIACQSMINLCLHDNHRTDNPLFNLENDLHLVEKIKANNSQNTEFLLAQISATVQRREEMHNCPYIFAPDFVHANKFGHEKLYNFIKLQSMLS